jgi:thiamine biosynthesis lipoprotein
MRAVEHLRGDVQRFRFRSMGTDVELLGPIGDRTFDAAARGVRATFDREDRRCSRFRADSELSRVNRNAGRVSVVSAPFADVVGAALRGAAETAGAFDPTLLDAVVAAGYDRTFDELLAGARIATRPGRPGGAWRRIRLEGRRLAMPAGVHLDLGGIAKGWTVDLAVERAIGLGLSWALVNAGGDLRLEGDVPAPLEVAIEDPDSPDAEIGRLHLARGAVATTSVTRRVWGPGLHHVIDPTTGSPAGGDVVQATVAARTCAHAEVLATSALLRGRDALPGVTAVLVVRDGVIQVGPSEVAA